MAVKQACASAEKHADLRRNQFVRAECDRGRLLPRHASLRCWLPKRDECFLSHEDRERRSVIVMALQNQACNSTVFVNRMIVKQRQNHTVLEWLLREMNCRELELLEVETHQH